MDVSRSVIAVVGLHLGLSCKGDIIFSFLASLWDGQFPDNWEAAKDAFLLSHTEIPENCTHFVCGRLLQRTVLTFFNILSVAD